MYFQDGLAMFELSAMYYVVDTVIGIARERGLTKVDTIVLEVGALSPAAPRRLADCFSAAADGTFLEQTKLNINELPAFGLCRKCGAIYDVAGLGKGCPGCADTAFELLCGKELNIKEIIAG